MPAEMHATIRHLLSPTTYMHMHMHMHMHNCACACMPPAHVYVLYMRKCACMPCIRYAHMLVRMHMRIRIRMRMCMHLYTGVPCIQRVRSVSPATHARTRARTSYAPCTCCAGVHRPDGAPPADVLPGLLHDQGLRHLRRAMDRSQHVGGPVRELLCLVAACAGWRRPIPGCMASSIDRS